MYSSKLVLGDLFLLCQFAGLSYLQEVIQPLEGHVMNQDHPCSKPVFFPCSYILNIWVVILHFFLHSFLSRCFNRCNTVTIWGALNFFWQALCLSLLKNTHSQTCRGDKCIHVLYLLTKGLPGPTPPIFWQMTVKFWATKANRRWLPSCLLANIAKLDKQDFHRRGWSAHLEFLKQFGDWDYLSTHAQWCMHACIWLNLWNSSFFC